MRAGSCAGHEWHGGTALCAENSFPMAQGIYCRTQGLDALGLVDLRHRRRRA